MLVFVVDSAVRLASVVCSVVDEAAPAVSVLSKLSVVSVVLALVVFECVVTADCEDSVVFDALEVVVAVVDTWTPGLDVGIVTEFAAEDAVSAMAEDDLATVVVIVAAVAGHNAFIIPPFKTIPNSVFELTDTSAQESLTALATDVSAD